MRTLIDEILPETLPISAMDKEVSLVDELTSTQFPFKYICSIEILLKSGVKSKGTGILIGPQTMLTAAHNIVDFEQKDAFLAHRIRVTPGRCGEERPFGSRLGKKTLLPPSDFFNQSEGPGSLFDFAILILESPFSQDVGFWGESRKPNDTRGSNIGYLKGWRSGKFKVNHSGYAGINNGVQSHWYSDTLPPDEEDILFIGSQINQGESGSPVWITRDKSLGGRHLIGMIVSGVGGTGEALEAEALKIHKNSPIFRAIESNRFRSS